MVAPSAITKDPSSSPSGVAPVANPRKGDNPHVPKVGTGQTDRRVSKLANCKIGLRYLMNPTVLSIISHFPNKCIQKKSEKYVVNGIVTPASTAGSDGEEKNNNLPAKKRPTATLKRYLGLFLAILSAMMFSFTGLIVKILHHHHALTQATWMFIATAVLALPLNLIRYAFTYYYNKHDEETQKSGTFKQSADHLEPAKVVDATGGLPSVQFVSNDPKISSPLKTKASDRKREIKLFLLLLVRACAGCSGMIFFFYSLKYLNVGDSLVIVCSSPIFVFIIGYLFLGESCGVVPVFTIILSIVGVAVITRPPMLTGKESFQTEEMIGAGLAFSSMLCVAITIITMRFLQNVYHGLINLVFGVFGAIQTTAMALATGVLEFPRDLQDAGLMMSTGVVFFLGQTFLAVSLQLEEAGPVSLCRTSEVVFAFVWQFIFLHVAPDAFSLSGAALILAGIFLTISRKWIASLPEHSASRKMLSFLLR